MAVALNDVEGEVMRLVNTLARWDANKHVYLAGGVAIAAPDMIELRSDVAVRAHDWIQRGTGERNAFMGQGTMTRELVPLSDEPEMRTLEAVRLSWNLSWRREALGIARA